jgi:hypothetical protein
MARGWLRTVAALAAAGAAAAQGAPAAVRIGVGPSGCLNFW